MFRKNRLYTHRNMLDSAILVLKALYISESDKFKLKIEWFNRRSKNSLNLTETITIPRKDLELWEEL